MNYTHSYTDYMKNCHILKLFQALPSNKNFVFLAKITTFSYFSVGTISLIDKAWGIVYPMIKINAIFSLGQYGTISLVYSFSFPINIYWSYTRISTTSVKKQDH